MPDQIFEIELLLGRIAEGDESARRELFDLTFERLRNLTRRMLRGFSGVRRWEETDDVWQNASMRLWRSMNQMEFKSARHYLNVGALQIRRELLNLATGFRRPSNDAANHLSPESSEFGGKRGVDDAQNPTDNIDNLTAWTELHEKVATLDDESREVFELLWYQGLTQEQVAEIVGVSIRTIRRRWQEARLAIYKQVWFDQ